MIEEELVYRITAQMRHAPTAEQRHAMETFARMMADGSTLSRPVMVMRGSAGTGKTTLAAAIVRALLALKQKLVLLAPTGRAAKVFSLYAGHAAFTIHRRIYRQRSAGDLSEFRLNDNLHRDTLFMVDEASMISSGGSTLAQGGSALGQGGSAREPMSFGSGSLLDDLVRYVYSGDNCRLLLIGDAAQLPPVGETTSPALSGSVLSGYGLTPYECDLSEVLRQSQESGILFNATRIRKSVECRVESVEFATAVVGDAVANSQLSTLRSAQRDAFLRKNSQLRLRGFSDITIVPGDELIESLASSYSRVGIDETIVITRSNKRANIYNQGIRRTVLDRDEELCRGDQLMVVKNNYSVSDLSPAGSEKSLNYLANGDRCVVQRVRSVRQLYGFTFADVTVQLPDYDDYELTATTLLDTLTTEAPALTREQQEQLYQQVMDDYADIPLKAERLKRLKSDPYYNALQVKFGYAVTCHKAQGGQWAHVYIDQGYMTDDMLTPDYYHWLYTALTRATEHVFLVNWPKTQIDEE